MKDVRPHGWCLTEDYQNLLDKDNDPDGKWNPGLDYYVRLVGRLGKVFKCNNTFSGLLEWVWSRPSLTFGQFILKHGPYYTVNSP